MLARNLRPGTLYPADSITLLASATGNYGSNLLLCLPFSLDIRADALVCHPTGTVGNIRAALYGAGDDGRSGELIEDLGELPSASALLVFPLTAPRNIDRPVTLAIILDTQHNMVFANPRVGIAGPVGGYTSLQPAVVSDFCVGFEMGGNYADPFPGNLRADNIITAPTQVPALALRSA